MFGSPPQGGTQINTMNNNNNNGGFPGTSPVGTSPVAHGWGAADPLANQRQQPGMTFHPGNPFSGAG